MTQIEPRDKTASSVKVRKAKSNNVPKVEFVNSTTQWSRSTPADGELFKKEFASIYQNLQQQVRFLNQMTEFFLNQNIGKIATFPNYEVPPNWIFCDSRLLLKSQFPFLFAALRGATWSDKTLFRIPDYQGYFLHGVNIGDSSKTDFGRSITAAQHEGLAIHTHDFSVSSNPYQVDAETINLRHIEETYENPLSHQPKSVGTSGSVYGPVGDYSKEAYSVYLKDVFLQKLRHSHLVEGSTKMPPQTQRPFAKETHPCNKAVVYCIRVDASVGVVDGGDIIETIPPANVSQEKYTRS